MSDGARWDSAYHAPVLAVEVVSLFAGRTRVLDGTLGGGGHSLALLEAGATVAAVDRDPAALAAARDRLARYEADGRFEAFLGNYASLDRVAGLAGRRFDAILLDLGISSHQIDDLARGFSFREGASLDMRMGDDAPADAAGLLNTADERELARVFRELRADDRRVPSQQAMISSVPFAAPSDHAPDPRSSPGSFRRCASRSTTRSPASRPRSLVFAIVSCPVDASPSWHTTPERIGS
jgi:16S rRNA (cytosine1402-N4)-methyltransferase